MGQGQFGIDPATVNRIAAEIKNLLNAGLEVGLVIGGGNIFRGAGLAEAGITRVTGDHMGMLATVMNALAMQDALEHIDVPARVMSAFNIGPVCENYDKRNAVRHIEQGRVVIFSAGTGNPYFTTDSAASLRAIEIEADLLVKATKVDGVYSADPMKDSSATRYTHLSFDDVLDQRLGVMDATAIVLCRENNMPLCVLDINKTGALMNAIEGNEEGTLVQ